MCVNVLVQSSEFMCECVGNNPGECMCKSTARDRRARMRAEAYRSMAYAHGQLWHISAARCGKSTSLSRATYPTREK